MLLHELDFSVVHPPDVLLLVFVALESTNAVGEAEPAIVVDGVHRVRIHLVEPGKVHAETISLVSILNHISAQVTNVLPSIKRM